MMCTTEKYVDPITNAIPGMNKAYKDIQRHADDSNVRALTGPSTCAQEILYKIHGCTSADDERYVPQQSARKDWGPEDGLTARTPRICQ